MEARRRRGRRAPAIRLAESISESSSHGEYDDRPETASVLRAAPHHFWTIWESVREQVPGMDHEQARELLDELPFKTTLEAAGWESSSARKKRYANRLRMRQECIARRREGRPLVVVPARELDERLASPAYSIAARKQLRRERIRALFRNSRRSRSPERIALDTATAVVLGGEAQATASMLAALDKAPAAALLDGRGFTPVGLSREGRALMSRRLLAVLADPKNRIALPEGSKLARKVTAYRQRQADFEVRPVEPASVFSAPRPAPENAKGCVRARQPEAPQRSGGVGQRHPPA